MDACRVEILHRFFTGGEKNWKKKFQRIYESSSLTDLRQLQDEAKKRGADPTAFDKVLYSLLHGVAFGLGYYSVVVRTYDREAISAAERILSNVRRWSVSLEKLCRETDIYSDRYLFQELLCPSDLLQCLSDEIAAWERRRRYSEERLEETGRQFALAVLCETTRTVIGYPRFKELASLVRVACEAAGQARPDWDGDGIRKTVRRFIASRSRASRDRLYKLVELAQRAVGKPFNDGTCDESIETAARLWGDSAIYFDTYL